MRAGPGLQAFLAGLQAFLAELNSIYCSKGTLQPTLRKPPKYETFTISKSTIGIFGHLLSVSILIPIICYENG